MSFVSEQKKHHLVWGRIDDVFICLQAEAANPWRHLVF